MSLGKIARNAADGKAGIVASIEPGAEFDGKITISAGSARLNSHFRGEIVGEGDLVIAECGEVEADVRVAVVTVSGKIKGSIHATERVEIKERGVILGDITTPVLVVEPGGFLDGQCHMPAPASEPTSASVAQAKDPSA